MYKINILRIKNKNMKKLTNSQEIWVYDLYGVLYIVLGHQFGPILV